MEYKEKYEIFFKEQCDLYQQILCVITQLAKCDTQLTDYSVCETPDTEILRSVTLEKAQLVQELNHLTQSAENAKDRILDILYLYHEFGSHPFYLHMERLQQAARVQLEKLLLIEDKNIPAIANNLNGYKEKLKTDIAVQKVPLERRKVFFLYPTN